MIFNEIVMVGKFYAQSIPTLTAWTVDDIHRFVFVEDEDNVYYGGTETYGDWIEMGKRFIEHGVATDPIDAVPFNDRLYTLSMVNGNLKFTYNGD
jgi:hypothetical protein